MKLTRVTITGLDERTPLARVNDLAARYPFVEFGILRSPKQEGNNNRYPSAVWVESAVRLLDPAVPLAAHLCGQYTRDAIEDIFPWAVNYHHEFARARRIQLNGAARYGGYRERARLLAKLFPDKEFIIPVPNFVSSPFDALPAMLLDSSGGRGVPIHHFPPPPDGIPCGYAGGLGPHNLEAALIALANGPSPAAVWVDMETGVRTPNNWLDMDKVESCLRTARPYVAA